MSDAYDDKLERKIRGKVRRGRRIVRIVVFLLLLIGIVSILRFFLTKAVILPDQALSPNVGAESTVMALMWVTTPEVGDVFLMTHDGNLMVRRVVAVPNSTLEMNGEGTWLDGVLASRTATEVPQLPENVNCETAFIETIGSHQFGICEGARSPSETVELGEGEYYVRCDNRDYCGRRGFFQGVVTADQLQGRVAFLMATPNDDDQPFYKRWFGRFEPIP